jgi:hypothetical protein
MVTRCPFVILGLDADAMAACPGFDGEVVHFSVVGATRVERGRSCLHLGESGGCHHPDADDILPMAAELCRADLSRNRPQVVVVEPTKEAKPRKGSGSPAA